MKLEISYNGSVRGILSAGQTAIIPKDMEFATDIVIRAVGVNLISFAIDGETYYAEKVMPWAEWVETEYNTKGWVVNGTTIRFTDSGGHGGYSTINNVTPTEEIISGNEYTTTYTKGGNND